MRFIVSGGGTGGHVSPALAIIRGLEERWPGSEFLYIGSKNGIEKDIVSRQGIAFAGIEISHGIDRRHIFTSVLGAFHSVPESFWQARRLIKEFSPHAVIGTGGYVSFPVVAAGEYLGYPSFIHEQNAWPGLSNRLLAKKATGTMLTFEEAQAFLKAKRIEITGLPVRPEILQAEREEAQQFFQISPDFFTVLIFGGSLGAASMNRAVLEMLPSFAQQPIQFLWVTGKRNYDMICEQAQSEGFLEKDRGLQLKIFPYLYEMEKALAVADLAVCRCGASTLSELEILGLPAILVPYPYAAENHQEKNGQSLVEKGAGVMIRDQELTGDILRKEIYEIWQNEVLRKTMKQNMQALAQPDSLHKIVAEIEKGIRQKGFIKKE